MNPKATSSFRFSRLALLAGTLFFGGTIQNAFATSPGASDTIGNDSENSMGRKVIANNFRYWAFGDFGYPGVAYSSDLNNWTTGHIFNRVYNHSECTTMT